MNYENQSEGSKALDQREHSSDAGAKRVVIRYQNPDNGDWYNFVPDMVSGVDYDFIDIQQTSSTVETYVFKLGGSGGSTVRTVTVTYTSSAKTDLDTVAYA